MMRFHLGSTEKAHEHLRETDRLRGDGELVKGTGS